MKGWNELFFINKKKYNQVLIFYEQIICILDNLCASGATLLSKLSGWRTMGNPSSHDMQVPNSSQWERCMASVWLEGSGLQRKLSADHRAPPNVRPAGLLEELKWSTWHSVDKVANLQLAIGCPTLYTWKHVCGDGSLEWEAPLVKCTLWKGKRAFIQ